MKNFDLEAAKKGAKICTREGRKARILCFDLYPNEYIAVAVLRQGFESVEVCRNNGENIYVDQSMDNLMMADDDYLEKLERGEYDRPDHIGEATEKVEDSRSIGNEWLNDMIKSGTSIFKEFERRLDIERQKYELSKLKHEADMLELERIPENWDYWRRMYAGMAMQGLCVAHGTKNSAEHIARGAVECADAIIEELKK